MSDKPKEPIYHGIVNLYHEGTLAGEICTAFATVAPRYGVRLEGIEYDINEWMDFWREVAKDLLSKVPADV